MQKTQLRILKSMTGHDFNFVPATQNKFGVKYYEYVCKNDAEYHNIAGAFNQCENVFYTALEHNDGTCSIIVLENQFDKNHVENVSYGYVDDISKLKPIGKLHGNNVFLEPILTRTGKASEIVSHSNRAVVVVNINGKRLPFYVSSGAAGKEEEYGITSGKWYPLQGISEEGWLNKMPDMNKNPYPEMDEICKILEKKFPAAKAKQDALDAKLPIANHGALLDFANSCFPEGMPYNHYGTYQFYRNHLNYLPGIIDSWRSKPTDFLEISDGQLQIPELSIMTKIQKTNLVAHCELCGDMIWLSPITSQLKNHTDGKTEDNIKQQLSRMGVDFSVIVTNDTKPGFGIPLRDFANYFNTQDKLKYNKATKKISTKKPVQKEQKTTNGILQNILKTAQNFIDK